VRVGNGGGGASGIIGRAGGAAGPTVERALQRGWWCMLSGDATPPMCSGMNGGDWVELM
jgi:hypothetical protein